MGRLPKVYDPSRMILVPLRTVQRNRLSNEEFRAQPRHLVRLRLPFGSELVHIDQGEMVQMGKHREFRSGEFDRVEIGFAIDLELYLQQMLDVFTRGLEGSSVRVALVKVLSQVFGSSQFVAVPAVVFVRGNFGERR